VLELAPGRQPAAERAIAEGACCVPLLRLEPTALGATLLSEGISAVAEPLVVIFSEKKE
jgi:hypothetical protein